MARLRFGVLGVDLQVHKHKLVYIESRLGVFIFFILILWRKLQLLHKYCGENAYLAHPTARSSPEKVSDLSVALVPIRGTMQYNMLVTGSVGGARVGESTLSMRAAQPPTQEHRSGQGMKYVGTQV